MDLTEAQWQVLKPLLTPKRRPDGRGRPWRDARAVFNVILWVLRTGAPWHDLADRYPPYQTCHRRFQQWQRDGTLTRLLHTLAEDLRVRGKLDLSETFIDASFSSAKKGALLSARLAAEKAVNHVSGTLCKERVRPFILPVFKLRSSLLCLFRFVDQPGPNPAVLTALDHSIGIIRTPTKDAFPGM
jgi:transposase